MDRVKYGKENICNGQNHNAVFVRDHKTSGPDNTILTQEEHDHFHRYVTYIRRKFMVARNDRLKVDRHLFRLSTGQSKPISYFTMIYLHTTFNLPVYEAGDSC